MVINFDDPQDTDTYFHRIGRTARFGKSGCSFLLMTKKKFDLFRASKHYKYDIKSIESEEAFQLACSKINQMIEGGLEKEEREDRGVHMGDTSLAAGWTEASKPSVYDTERFKYVESRVDMDEDSGVDEDEMDEEDIDYGDGMEEDGGEEEKGESRESEVKEDIAEEGAGRNWSIGKRDIDDEGFVENEMKSQDTKKLESSNRQIDEKGRKLSFEAFSQLFDMMGNRRVCEILRATQEKCDIDFTFLKMYSAFTSLTSK